ncbi:hypothetical protein BC828DRAFT_405322 [Blastocladiella britannica]|nr:hypothetical protein BC828DRAFT_405322 [Blastocladiella britannica]
MAHKNIAPAKGTTDTTSELFADIAGGMRRQPHAVRSWIWGKWYPILFKEVHGNKAAKSNRSADGQAEWGDTSLVL